MTIIFSGHFSIGETVNGIQLKTVEAAKKIDGRFGLIVNDIDLKRRLQFYRMGGREMVIKHYGGRKKCGTTAPLCELPDYETLPELIDWDFYDSALSVLQNSNTDMTEVLRLKIVPTEIQKRLELYGLPADMLVYSERALRNLAGNRLSSAKRKMKQTSWLPFLEKIDLLDSVQAPISKIPTCGGIMLALFEKLSKERFSKIVQCIDKADQYAFDNGRELCETLHRYFPEDPRWNFEFEHRYFE